MRSAGLRRFGSLRGRRSGRLRFGSAGRCSISGLGGPLLGASVSSGCSRCQRTLNEINAFLARLYVKRTALKLLGSCALAQVLDPFCKYQTLLDKI